MWLCRIAYMRTALIKVGKRVDKGRAFLLPDLPSTYIVFPVDCVWPLCTAGAGICVIKTARNRRKRTFYVLKNRLAVMHRLAVHNVTRADCSILPHHAVRRSCVLLSH